MCVSMGSRTVSPPKTITPPPPPEKAPAELENAIDSSATELKKRKRGAKGAFGRKTAAAQYAGNAAKTGLKIS